MERGREVEQMLLGNCEVGRSDHLITRSMSSHPASGVLLELIDVSRPYC